MRPMSQTTYELPKDLEAEGWRALSAERLRECYGENEEEYPLERIKEANSENDSK